MPAHLAQWTPPVRLAVFYRRIAWRFLLSLRGLD
jgi:hypothetical protein